MSAFPLGLLISGEIVRIMELVADIHPMTKPCMTYNYKGKSFVSTHAVITSLNDRAL